MYFPRHAIGNLVSAAQLNNAASPHANAFSLQATLTPRNQAGTVAPLVAYASALQQAHDAAVVAPIVAPVSQPPATPPGMVRPGQDPVPPAVVNAGFDIKEVQGNAFTPSATPQGAPVGASANASVPVPVAVETPTAPTPLLAPTAMPTAAQGAGPLRDSRSLLDRVRDCQIFGLPCWQAALIAAGTVGVGVVAFRLLRR